MVIAPLLNECKRYQEGVRSVRLITPVHRGRGKFIDYKVLIAENQSIVATHALMKQMDTETIELLRLKDYVLIIDEALEVLSPLDDTKQDDIDIIFKQKLISIDESGYLSWHDDTYDGNKFRKVKKLCDLHTLMSFKTADGRIAKTLMWSFPVEFFDCFSEIYVMTYLWEGSLQKAYFDLHSVRYDKWMLDDNREMIPYDGRRAKKQQIEAAKRIRVYEGNLNIIGKRVGRTNPMTKTWYENCKKSEGGKAKLRQLKNNTKNFFQNILHSSSSDNMYTTYEDYKGYVKGDGYTKGFVPCNCRATNDFADKKALAYLVNFNPSPEVDDFTRHYGISFDRDKFALSALLQWIWRSQIRKDDEDGMTDRSIDLYIPSERMRRLLKQWTAGEI